ncbi:MAG: DNA polymerase III subunit chi [Desulfuromonas sp.]|nr:MAG: DNA polymerase III subunit chi [Desulfuromonas sp.]
MAVVKFVKLENQNKPQQLCRLTEYFYRQGKRLLLLVQDENQAISYDRFLWTWDKGAFLPHACDIGSVECYQEPIVITARENNPNNADILILGVPADPDFMSRFDLIIDFAELYDAGLAEASRDRFRHYRTLGLNPQMFDLPE